MTSIPEIWPYILGVPRRGTDAVFMSVLDVEITDIDGDYEGVLVQ